MANQSIVIAKSAQRTASFDVPIDNHDCTRMHLVIDCTAVGGGSITVTVQAVDPASNKKYALLASATIAGVGMTVLRIGDGVTAAANLTATDHLPKRLNINVVHANANPIAYSIGAALIV